jgi:hypothetical protein
MLPLGLLLAAVAVPVVAFSCPAHSTGRTVLALGISYWTLPLVALAWMALSMVLLYAVGVVVLFVVLVAYLAAALD